MMKIAIVTTVKKPTLSFNSWVQFHQTFADHLFIYFDDHAERDLPQLPQSSAIHYFLGSQTQVYQSPIDNNMIRQGENIAHAVKTSLELGIEWLIHIDLDELLYTTRPEIEGLFSNPNVGQVVFTNHEAIPVWESSNFFQDCHYFKVSKNSYAWNVNPWFFLAYGNGKSAARVTPELQAYGPHRFSGFQGETLENLETPFVLHYPNATFQLWKEKYENLGQFGNYWYEDPNFPNDLTFYGASRDVYQQCTASGDFSPAEAFFRNLMPSPEDCNRMVEAGALIHLDPLARLK